MGKISMKRLEKALRREWDDKTSSDPVGWLERNPYRVLMRKEHHGLAIKQGDGYYTDGKLEEVINENPAWGQCAVTALVVQDYLGGKLVRVPVMNIPGMQSHYYNELPDGSEIDISKSQFEGLDVQFGAKAYRERDYVLSPEYPQTIKRYGILKNRVEKFLSRQLYNPCKEHS